MRWAQVGEIDTKLVNGLAAEKTCPSRICVFYPVYEATSEISPFKKFLDKFVFCFFGFFFSDISYIVIILCKMQKGTKSEIRLSPM